MNRDKFYTDHHVRPAFPVVEPLRDDEDTRPMPVTWGRRDANGVFKGIVIALVIEAITGGALLGMYLAYGWSGALFVLLLGVVALVLLALDARLGRL